MKYTEQEDKLLKEFYPLKGARFCSEKLNRKVESIWDRAKTLKLKINKEVLSEILTDAFSKNKKYSLNENIFLNEKTPESCYLLGLLWADGSIRNGKNSYVIRITLKAQDGESLIPIFNKTGKWSIIKCQYKCHKNPVIAFTVSSKKIWQYLHDNGYLTKSGGSATKILKEIPDKLKQYWWRGYIDGDGYFSKKQLEIKSTYEQNWDFALSVADFRESKRTFLNKNRTKEYRYSAVSLSGRIKIASFVKFLYSENIEIGLERKRKAALNFMQYFDEGAMNFP